MAEVSASHRITLVIEGLPENNGRVRLSDFLGELQKVGAALSRLDKEANGKPTHYFEIAELSYNSPLRVVIEARGIDPRSDVASYLDIPFQNLSNIFRDEYNLSEFDAELLEDVRGLTKPIGKTIKYAALAFDGQTFELTKNLGLEISLALETEEECEGVIDGMLEQINVHRGANVFNIYPQIGPTKVACKFPQHLYDDAIAAVGRKVEVSGVLKYRAGASFPYHVSVTAIETFADEGELPDWDDLRGLAPDATGSLSSEAFVRELRDAWPEAGLMELRDV